MKRFLVPLFALVALTAPALSQTRALPPGEIRANGDITFGNALKLGKRDAGKTIITPDTLQILGPGSTGDVSAMSVLSGVTGAVNRTIAEKLFERLSINDFYRPTDGNDFLPAINRAVAALPASGGTIYLPRREGCYLVSNVAVIGDGSANGPSTKQNVRFVGDTGSGTGGQTGFGADKGTCIKYGGATKIAGILQFNGPMAMGLEGIVLEGGYLGYSASPSVTTTSGFNSLTGISSMSNVVVGAAVTGPGIPAGTIVTGILSSNSVSISNNATASATITAAFTHNQATVDRGLVLNHVFRSTVRNVGIKNARVGMRQDSYGVPNNFVAGSNDNTFENIWCENGAVAGGTSGSGCFDIGGSDATGILDVARSTYTNLTGIGAGDPNYTGLVLRYADNLTFRGGMMYSQREPGLGYALGIIPPTGTGREPAFPAEITFEGMAMIGRIYRDPRWKPASNGNFSINFWPMHSGDMLDPHNPGRGTVPSSGEFIGVDDRGVFFGWSQWRSWLDDAAGISVAYDAPATLSRKTTLTQVAGTTAETVYATHKLPANAMRSRNSKDYPANATFPLADAAQYAYDRVVAVKQSGNWFNNNTAATVTVRVKLGSTTLFDSGAVSLPASQFYGAWRLDGELSQSASNAQSFNGRLTFGPGGSGQGSVLPIQADLFGDRGASVDMTTDQTITVTVTPSATAFIWNAERSMATVH